MAGATEPVPPIVLAISTEIACFCAQQQKAFLTCKVNCAKARAPARHLLAGGLQGSDPRSLHACPV